MLEKKGVGSVLGYEENKYPNRSVPLPVLAQGDIKIPESVKLKITDILSLEYGIDEFQYPIKVSYPVKRTRGINYTYPKEKQIKKVEDLDTVGELIELLEKNCYTKEGKFQMKRMLYGLLNGKVKPLLKITEEEKKILINNQREKTQQRIANEKVICLSKKNLDKYQKDENNIVHIDNLLLERYISKNQYKEILEAINIKGSQETFDLKIMAEKVKKGTNIALLFGVV